MLGEQKLEYFSLVCNVHVHARKCMCAWWQFGDNTHFGRFGLSTHSADPKFCGSQSRMDVAGTLPCNNQNPTPEQTGAHHIRSRLWPTESGPAVLSRTAKKRVVSELGWGEAWPLPEQTSWLGLASAQLPGITKVLHSSKLKHQAAMTKS